jgi:hypothetical protein
MEGIYLIGDKVYCGDSDRLFAHQFGDGFIVVSNSYEKCLDRPIAIAISLMRCVLAHNGMAKAAISEGGFSDIKDCYPAIISENQSNGRCKMGRGLMSIFPAMGTALINAVAIDKKSPSSSLITIAKENEHRISSIFPQQLINENLVSIGWLKGHFQLVEDITKKAGLKDLDEKQRISQFKNYLRGNNLKRCWKENSSHYQGVII